MPEKWQIKNPRVTVLSSGLLTLGVLAAITNATEVGQGMQTNLIPRDWAESGIDYSDPDIVEGGYLLCELRPTKRRHPRHWDK